jgi:hypothetical protein
MTIKKPKITGKIDVFGFGGTKVGAGGMGMAVGGV